MKPVYKRILLKLSGEVLAGEKGVGIDFDKVLDVCKSVKDCCDLGIEVAIVVGGGNFWRGRSSGKMDRTRADHMGMLATTINSLAIADALEQLGVTARVQTAIEMRQIAEPYIRNKAVRHLEKGRVVIFGCGTGNPFLQPRLCVRQKSGRTLFSRRQTLTAFMTATRKRTPTLRSSTPFPTLTYCKRDFTLWTAPPRPFVWITALKFLFSTLTIRTTLLRRLRASK